MARFQVETFADDRGNEKYCIRDTLTGDLVARSGVTTWNNYTAAFGWANRCNAVGHTDPTPEPIRNPRMGM